MKMVRILVAGFRDFLMRGDVIVVAIGLVVALAFSNLVKSFTDDIINPMVDSAQKLFGAKEAKNLGLGWQLGEAGDQATFLNFGAFISACIYFIVFMGVVYFCIVIPYKHISAKRGVIVFGDLKLTKTCPFCKSTDLPATATRCKHCTSELNVSNEDS